MRKINVFAQYPHGDVLYKSQYCTGNTTIMELLIRCNLSTHGASVYLDGERLNKQQWSKSISSLNTRNHAFLSLRYGEDILETKKTGSRKAGL